MKTLNNNIEEHYCYFEVSKLLKEAGFNVNTTHWYNMNEVLFPKFICTNNDNGKK